MSLSVFKSKLQYIVLLGYVEKAFDRVRSGGTICYVRLMLVFAKAFPF